MPLHFTKLHGLGNDYVYVSLFDQRVDDPAALARAISDRHCGVGSDGLILVGPPDAGGADVRMVMYNADGSRAQMCGNGIRCLAKLVWDRGWARRNPLKVQTDRGVLTLDLVLNEADLVEQVRVDMGPPVLHPRDVPVALEGERVVAHALEWDTHTLYLTCVSMGNPHAVFFVPALSAIPLAEWGPRLENHPLFPQRTNVHFAHVERRDFVRIITWERGAGATQACGTGAAAVCVAGVLNHLTDRRMTIALPGGELRLTWAGDTGHVFMTGPAVEVFTGAWPS
jgi:diaminopimelate epimerase